MPKRILIVDDEPDAISYISSVLEDKMPLIFDCYFMTLIAHLSRAEPDVEAALTDLHAKFRQIIPIESLG
jgi:CheY-like chemotaxis protein